MQFFDYLRDTKAELRHVTWPSRAQTINYTLIVVAISVIVGVFLGLLDYGFTKGLGEIINN